jgi:hypothetical protein
VDPAIKEGQVRIAVVMKDESRLEKFIRRSAASVTR